jgi:hypothetical protein
MRSEGRIWMVNYWNRIQKSKWPLLLVAKKCPEYKGKEEKKYKSKLSWSQLHKKCEEKSSE